MEHVVLRIAGVGKSTFKGDGKSGSSWQPFEQRKGACYELPCCALVHVHCCVAQDSRRAGEKAGAKAEQQSLPPSVRMQIDYAISRLIDSIH